MKGLVGDPLLVGGLGPGPPALPPLKSGPVTGNMCGRRLAAPELYFSDFGNFKDSRILSNFKEF